MSSVTDSRTVQFHSANIAEGPNRFYQGYTFQLQEMDMCPLFLSILILGYGIEHIKTSPCESLLWHKETNADYIIAGIFPVHYLSSIKSSYVFNLGGLTWLQAMLLAIDEINNDKHILPNVKIGYAIYDSCNSESFGLQATLDIIQEPRVIPSYPRTLSFSKHPKDAVECFCNKTKPAIIAVIGDASSSTSTRIASVLGARGISMPQISYSSTSTVLSNKKYYPSFLRTIPPDEYQAMFIIDIFKKFKWTYVSFIASDDAYGRLGVENLLPRLEHENICVAVNDVFETTDAGKAKVKEVVAKLVKDEKSKVIVLWCQHPEADFFLKEAERQKLFDRIWIATETWGNNPLVKKINARVVSGLLGIIPTAVDYAPFDSYLNSIQPNNSKSNPWLDLYWRNEFGCRSLNNATYICDKKEHPNAQSLPRNKFANVMDAVYAVAHGLNAAIKDSKSNLSITPEKLLSYIKFVEFSGKGNLNVSFNKNGDPVVASYSLTNLQRNGVNEMDFAVIGAWDSHSRRLNLKGGTVMFANWSSTPPNSSCSEECMPGSYALIFTSKPCCWTCVPCSKNEIQPKFGMKTCTRCYGDEVPNANQTRCIIPTYDYVTFDSVFGVLISVCSMLAIVITLSSLGIVLRHWDSPLVKAMNRELTMFQLISIIVIFCMPLLYMSRPTNAHCAVRPFYFVIFYTISVSVTFTKTDRLLRIFKASTTGRLSKGSRVLNNRIQFLTVFALTIVACLLCIIFYFVFRPKLCEKVESNSSGALMSFSCGTDFPVLLLILLGYIFAISLTCSIFAFKARKLPENYNEARYTSFAMFSFCLAWMFFLPLYFSMSSAKNRDIIFLVISFISTFARLLILYGPKIVVIVFRPEENTMERFRAKLKAQRSNRGSGASPSQHARGRAGSKETLKISKKSSPETNRCQVPARNFAFEVSVDQGKTDSSN